MILEVIQKEWASVDKYEVNYLQSFQGNRNTDLVLKILLGHGVMKSPAITKAQPQLRDPWERANEAMK